MNYKITTVAFGALRKIRGPSLQWQYNEKQYLVIKGLDLPEYYAVDFCNEGDADTITMTPTENGVEIPDQFLLTGKPLVAYVVVVDGESVNTIGQITFPVNVRGRRTDISPEPAEQQQIDSLIGALNDGVSRAETAAEAAEQAETEIETYVERAETAASSAETAAGNAATSETNAANSAESATSKASEAASSAERAGQNASAANASAGSAAQSESSASASASAAAGSASSAASSANSASASAGQAASSAQSASGSASQAAGSAQSASGSAASASQSATNAATKAQEAASKATEAGNAKDAAVTAKNDAVTAKNAAETAQGKAEEAQAAAEEAAESIEESAAQIAQNTQDISDINNEIDEIAPAMHERYDWSVLGTQTYPLGWQTGYYNNGAANSSSTLRMRTTALSNFAGFDEFTVVPPEGKYVVVAVFSSSAGGTSNFVENIGGSEYAEVTVTVNPDYYYGFFVALFTTKDPSTNYLTQEYIDTIQLELSTNRIVKCDSEMSDSSIAPVQNKVAKAYVDGIVGKIVNHNFDITPEWKSGVFSTTEGADIRASVTATSNRQSSNVFMYPYPIAIECDDGGYLIRATYADANYAITKTDTWGQGVFFIVPANTPVRLAVKNYSDTSITDVTSDELNQHIKVTALFTYKDFPVNWCAMGDSITKEYYSTMSGGSSTTGQDESKVYTGKVAKLNGWMLTNIARGATGYLMGVQGQTNTAGWYVARNTDFTQYNLVTLAYGVNDWKGNLTMGSMADDPTASTPSTVIQAMRATIEAIMASNPTCKIIVILPLNCVGYSYAYGDKSTNYGLGYEFPNTGTLESFVQKMIEVCDYYGIQYIDQTHYSVINRENLLTALPDGVHPSPEFHDLLAHELSRKITF